MGLGQQTHVAEMTSVEAFPPSTLPRPGALTGDAAFLTGILSLLSGKCISSPSLCCMTANNDFLVLFLATGLGQGLVEVCKMLLI